VLGVEPQERVVDEILRVIDVVILNTGKVIFLPML